MQLPTNLARLDLVSIHLLLQCASQGSISAAAKRCHMSVMSASVRLRRLEDTLGKPLFHRHRRGLAPTEAGTAVLRAAEHVLLAVGEMLAEGAAAPCALPRQGANTGRRPKMAGAGVTSDAFSGPVGNAVPSLVATQRA